MQPPVTRYCSTKYNSLVYVVCTCTVYVYMEMINPHSAHIASEKVHVVGLFVSLCVC